MSNEIKSTKNAWFIYRRKSYLPASWQGLVIYLIYAVYIISLAVLWYKRGHHLWILLSTVIPLIIGAAFVTQYVAFKNSNKIKDLKD